MRTLVLILGALLILPATVFGASPLTVKAAVKEITLKGYTRSRADLTVSSEVSGKVVSAAYEVGQVIGKAPFFSIDKTFIDLQIQATRRELAKLSVSEAKIVSRAGYLKKEFDRIDQLLKGNSTAKSKWDSAAENLAQAGLEKEAVAADKAILHTRLAELTERRRRHDIHAPDGWIVVEKRAEAGEIIGANAPLARVADFSDLLVPLSVSGEEYKAIRALPPVFEARLEGKPVTAAVYRINPEFDEKTRKLALELILRDITGEKRGGLAFNLPLVIGADGLRVPKAAVTSRYENPKVTLGKSGETLKVLILGESDGHFIVREDPRLSPGTLLKPAE